MSGLDIFFVIAGVATFLGTGIGCWQIYVYREQRRRRRDEQLIPTGPRSSRAVWLSVPSRNRNFTGRNALLDTLHRAFFDGDWAGATQVLTGLGGVGKTQVAIEYIHRHAREYKLVAWLRAEQPAALQTDMRALGEALGISASEGMQFESLVRSIHGRLACRDAWLLVFDNAGSPETLRPHLPACSNGHVLITSRNPLWGSIARPIMTDVFTREESISFLLKRTCATDQGEANALAETLGDLPLALELAGAYVEATGVGLGCYAERFQARHNDLWKGQTLPDQYSATVATTWLVDVEALRRESPDSVPLLELFSFLAPDDIPVALLRKGAAALPRRLRATFSDDIARDHAMAGLRQYSLISGDSDSASIHRLLQLVVRDQLKTQRRQSWIRSLAGLVVACLEFDANDTETWLQTSRLIPHVESVISHASACGVSDEVLARIRFRAGLYHSFIGSVTRAHEHLEFSVDAFTRLLGPEHPETAEALNALGGTLMVLGDLDGARNAFERALWIFRRRYGDRHHLTATALGNVGYILGQMGEYAAAISTLAEALSVERALAGGDNIRIASKLHELGDVLRDAGDPSKSKEQIEQALEIARRLGPPNSYKIGVLLDSLGVTLRELGDLQHAAMAHRQALPIFEKHCGKDSRHTGTVLRHVGWVLLDLGQFERARRVLEKALSIEQKAYGSESPLIGDSLNALGLTFRELGYIGHARAAIQRALDICKGSQQPFGSPEAASLNNLALILRDEGDLAGANEALDAALAISERKLGASHPAVATHLGNLAEVLCDRGDCERARALLTRALSIDRRAFGHDHPAIARDLAKLGWVLCRVPDTLGSAQTALEEALLIDQRCYGHSHPKTARDLTYLGLLYVRIGSRRRAAVVLRQALKICRKYYGETHERTRRAREHLRGVLEQ